MQDKDCELNSHDIRELGDSGILPLIEPVHLSQGTQSALWGRENVEENLEEGRTALEEKDRSVDSVTGDRANMSVVESINEPCVDYTAITWFLDPLLQVWMENFIPVAIERSLSGNGGNNNEGTSSNS